MNRQKLGMSLVVEGSSAVTSNVSPSFIFRIVFLTIITGSGQRIPSASSTLSACSTLNIVVISQVNFKGLDDTGGEKIFNNLLANDMN